MTTGPTLHSGNSTDDLSVEDLTPSCQQAYSYQTCHSFSCYPSRKIHISFQQWQTGCPNTRDLCGKARGCKSHVCFSGVFPAWSEFLFTRHHADMGQLDCHLQFQAFHTGVFACSPQAHAGCLYCEAPCHTAHAGSDNAACWIPYLRHLLLSVLELLPHPAACLHLPHPLPLSSQKSLHKMRTCTEGKQILPELACFISVSGKW